MLIPLSEIIEKHLPEGHTPIKGVIDIGSHKGESLSEYEAVETIKRVLWIEANPLVVAELHTNTNKCKRKGFINEYENELLSDTTGQRVELSYPNEKSSEARMGSKQKIAQHTVMTDKEALLYSQGLADITSIEMFTRRFDDLWRNKKVYLDMTKYQMIRVDVGGDEPAVLDGFGKLFDTFSDDIKYIYVSTYKTLPQVVFEKSNLDTCEAINMYLIGKGFGKLISVKNRPDKNGQIYGEAFYAR